MSFDTIYKGSTIVTHNKTYVSDIAVRDGKIIEIGDFSKSDAKEIIDLKDLHLLPGVIDTQVHFREPGGEHKEDLSSGTKAAVLGGVTGVFEMPNTEPSTTNEAALMDKFSRANGRLHCDYAFYVGGTPDNYLELPELEKIEGCCGVKVFMGLSTGTLLVSGDEDLDKIFEGWGADAYDRFVNFVAESRSQSYEDIKKVAGGRVWIATTAQEIGLVDEIGGIDEAIAFAVAVSEVEDHKVEYFSKELSAEDMIIRELLENFDIKLAEPKVFSMLGSMSDAYQQLIGIKQPQVLLTCEACLINLD